MRKLELTKERLLAKAERRGECVVWTGPTAGNGYGVIKHGGKRTKVHRASYELHKGAIPAGMQVLHRCDNPACINPEHLFLGTHADNMNDRSAKGRVGSRSGDENSNAKITADDVVAIRKRYVKYDRKNGLAAIARDYGLTSPTVQAIVERRTWKRIP